MEYSTQVYTYRRSCMINCLKEEKIIETYFFIIEASNPIIIRWYMALSEFSFTLEFTPGVENNIADAIFSTLFCNITLTLTNKFCQRSRSQLNQVVSNTQRLICCTNQLLAALNLNVYLNVSRI